MWTYKTTILQPYTGPPLLASTPVKNRRIWLAQSYPGGGYCIQNREKMLEFSLAVLSMPTPYH